MFLLGWLPLVGHAAPMFVPLGDLPGGLVSSHAAGISADGQTVVGGSHGASGSEPFRWTRQAGMTGMGQVPGIVGAGAAAASADGAIIAASALLIHGIAGIRWTEAAGVDGLSSLAGGDPAPNDSANDISDDGFTIVGHSDGRAVRWVGTPGAETAALALGAPGGEPYSGSIAYGVSANGATIVGSANGSVGREAFVWTSETGMLGIGDLTGGGFDSIAYAVSGDGSTVVGRGLGAAGAEAFRWTQEGGLVGLGHLPQRAGMSAFSSALATSADGGVIVGSSNYAEGLFIYGLTAFLWDEAHGMRNLRTVLEGFDLDLTGWRLTEATGISADGRVIVGDGINPQGHHEAWLAVIPEPGTAALLAVGLAVMARGSASRSSAR
jgi:uncharacterized membrane protein